MQASDTQAFAQLSAKCKAAGVALLRARDDKGRACFVVSQWGQYRELPTLDAVRNWLDWTYPRSANA